MERISGNCPSQSYKVVVRPLQEYESNWFVVNAFEVVECKCVPPILFYFCVFFVATDMSAVRHNVAIRRQGV